MSQDTANSPSTPRNPYDSNNQNISRHGPNLNGMHLVALHHIQRGHKSAKKTRWKTGVNL
ncbi:uncharacterized protein GLRG_11329 [Colletotrichum graminicola M1.001]|uniref:Uncharacterized protein n=1 Tax=Colletotrichum graminicola (strain M1.001 / M2 / FGSC 10212) TaxID=645133 RepID=E3QZ77_COLGM|nr:uncharacterized protein GLRG_11329 [Colletotrichum graminicola M1.001]EFQ36165.1 hypothetical protein GLRG_11329 [Colletotrichum graminicola M1.001]